MTTDESLITDELRNAVGIDSAPLTYEVEKGAVIRFADAIEDPNPVYRDEVAARDSRYGGLIAPPTFLRSMAPGPATVEARSPLTRTLDGGSEWEFFYPVRPGDLVTVTVKLAK